MFYQPAVIILFTVFFVGQASAAQGILTMWATSNDALSGAACEYGNSPLSITDPILPSYLRDGFHCAIGTSNPAFGSGEECGKCYTVNSLSNTGTGGTSGTMGTAVVMVSNSGAGGDAHFDCILSSFQAITGASTGIFNVEFTETPCTQVTGPPVVLNWADQNAYYCKMMFENIGGWGQLESVKACINENCAMLTQFSGATWTGCPTGTANSISFELTQKSPSNVISTIPCTCAGAWPWATGQSCVCSTNFGSGGTPGTSSPTSTTTAPPTIPTVGTSSPTSTTPTAAPATPTAAPATPTAAPAECSASGQDCRVSKCCEDSGMQCYVKDAYWASCKASCTPGIDPYDPPCCQTAWTCDLAANAPYIVYTSKFIGDNSTSYSSINYPTSYSSINYPSYGIQITPQIGMFVSAIVSILVSLI